AGIGSLLGGFLSIFTLLVILQLTFGYEYPSYNFIDWLLDVGIISLIAFPVLFLLLGLWVWLNKIGFVNRWYSLIIYSLLVSFLIERLFLIISENQALFTFQLEYFVLIFIPVFVGIFLPGVLTPSLWPGNLHKSKS